MFTVKQPTVEESIVWIGLGLLYLILLFTTGVIALRKGHLVLFIVGFIFPILWIIGVLMQPTGAAVQAAEENQD